MIRLTHLSGSLRGTASTSPKAIVRIGRGADCDVRFDARLDARVSTHHAEIRFESGHYVVVDVGSSNGTLVNGRMVKSQKLRPGDTIVFGAQGGPEAKFEIDESAVDALAKQAQQKIAQARALSGGKPSGQTLFIMADTLQQVEAVTQKKSGKKWKKVVLAVVLAALCGFGALGFVIWEQKQQLEKLLHKKNSFDKQIQKIQLAMQLESDPDRLSALEEQLTLVTGKAQATIGELEQKDKTAAARAEDQGDELDRAIRRILRKFDADTYAVPPIFRERLQHYIQQKTANRHLLRQVYDRKRQFWPVIVKEFSARGLPEEIAFVAWQESSFDPFAVSPAGARGMWQFMDFKAREFGMRVDPGWRKGGVDERTDVTRSTRAAAQYLHNLLSDFGSDSFMLAIASYNKGEPGMRRVLHQVGFRKDQRDFWHLYRLKKLPEETMEYVPQILAAAIICNEPKKYGLE